MPKREDIRLILITGTGPIMIGQAGEFDHSGTQACKALREEGVWGHPCQFQSRFDHDRSGSGGCDLRGADHPADCGEDHQKGASQWTARRHGGDRRP